MGELLEIWLKKLHGEPMISLTEADVISIMRKNLKRKSYIIWRKRVRGRFSKHRKINRVKYNNYEF